jgi:pimeloyl-ACP methyl ester carboxylesterase
VSDSAPELIARIADGDDGVNTINVSVTPVIFVPGVMGSRLVAKGAINWDPDAPTSIANLAISSLSTKQKTLSVDVAGDVQVIKTLSSSARADIERNLALVEIAAALKTTAANLYAKRGWGGVAWGFYGKILMDLETSLNTSKQGITLLGGPVYAFGYDFRQSNIASGLRLQTFIADVLSQHPRAEQVIVVTHSMGGLVARAAMATNPAIISSIRTVIHGAQPSMGAVVAYRRFFTGAVTSFDGGDTASFVLERVIGSTPDEYRELQVGLPGPLELLPSHLYARNDVRMRPWLVMQPQPDLSTVPGMYMVPLSPPGLLKRPTDPLDVSTLLFNGRLAARLAAAGAFHVLLADGGHPNTHVLFSTGVATDVATEFAVGDGKLTTAVVKEAQGDGTVPAISGACLGMRPSLVKSRTSFNGLEHSAVYQDTAFNNAVIRLIQASQVFVNSP